jgi:hypothetical protein
MKYACLFFELGMKAVKPVNGVVEGGSILLVSIRHV